MGLLSTKAKVMFLGSGHGNKSLKEDRSCLCRYLKVPVLVPDWYKSHLRNAFNTYSLLYFVVLLFCILHAMGTKFFRVLYKWSRGTSKKNFARVQAWVILELLLETKGWRVNWTQGVARRLEVGPFLKT